MKVGMVVGALLLWSTGALATPITYQFVYTAGPTTGIPGNTLMESTTFSFTLDEPPSMSGLVPLSTPLTIGTVTVGSVGTNQSGWWLFSDPAAGLISDGGGSLSAVASCNYLKGPCYAFIPDVSGGLSGTAWGQNGWSPDPTLVERFDGRLDLIITHEEEPTLRLVTPVPETGSTLDLLLVGALLLLGSVSCWKR